MHDSSCCEDIFEGTVQSNTEADFSQKWDSMKCTQHHEPLTRYEFWLTGSLDYAIVQYIDELDNKGGHLLALVHVQLTFSAIEMLLGAL